MKVFLFDNSVNEVMLSESEILLIKEFSALWTNDRNITKEDPKGVKKRRAFREFTYMWLMCDWASPYSDYPERDRHEEALKDAKMTDEEWADPIFRAACRKYRELQESSRSLKLIRSAQGIVDKITTYFDNLDIEERDPLTGKPIFKTKEVMAEMSGVSTVIEQLKTLEFMYKKEMEEVSSLMGDVVTGFAD